MRPKLLLILFIISFCANLYGQWQINGVAVCDTIGKQHVAANGILSDGAGGTFVVWGDNRDSWDIYAQHVDSSGRMLWGKQGKPICTQPGWQFAPVVTHDSEGGFVTAWGDTRNDTRDVYAQRVDKDGNILWDVDGLQVVHYEQFQGVSDIILATDSTFIMVWRDDRFFPDSSSIHIQKITKEGLKLLQDDGVRVSNDPGSPRLVSDEKGGAFVIWAGDSDDGILVQHIDNNGNRLWNMPGKLASVGNADWGDSDFTVCPDGYGGAYIAWDYSETDHCYFQRIDSSGERIWGNSGLQIVSNEISQKTPSILKFDPDSIIYLWQDNFYIRMQIFSKDGDRKFFTMGIRLTNYKTSRYLSSIYHEDEILISHPEITNFFPNEFIVKAQKTNTSGFLFWDSSGVTVSNIEFSPDVVRGFSVSDGKGGIITAWDDDRNDVNTLTDIYIQRVYSNGKVGGDSATTLKPVNHFVPKKFNVKVYPNPFNNSVNIEFSLVKNSNLDITVFDINGRTIWKKNEQNYYSGKHTLTWEGQNNNGKEVSSGIYFIAVSGKQIYALRKVLLIK